MVVVPSWRRRGVGRMLLDRHVARLGEARVQALFLEVNADNVAGRALYARAGFTEVGRRKGYYPGTSGDGRADALVLRRPIG